MRSITLIFALLVSSPLFAQLQRNFTSYTVDNGLAQNSVWDALQDYKGYMWFGTADGVNRFDGYKMEHYKWNSKDSSSLLGNSFFKFYEDSDNNLWIGHNKGVSIYNRAKNCFTNLPIETSYGNGEKYTTVLGEDTKGRVWCVSGSHQLVGIAKKDFSVLKQIPISNSRFAVSSTRTCVITNKYIIGYLNDSSITWFRFNMQTETVDIINGPATFTGYFLRYNDSTICTFDKANIYFYNINQNKFTSKPIGGKIGVISSLIATSLVWWQGKIYLGNNTGLYVFNPINLQFEERITSFNKTDKVGFYYVQFLRVDKSGNLWICTNGDGVKCLSPYRNKFKHYNSTESRNKLVKSITSDSAKNIYTGLYAEGLITYKNNGNIEQYKFGKSTDELTHVLAAAFWDNSFFVVNDRYLKELNPVTKKEISRTDVFHYKNHGYCAYPYFHHYKNKLYLSCDLALYEINKKSPNKLLLKFNSIDTIITTITIINDTTWWIGTTRHLFNFHPIKKTWKKLPVDIYVKTICLSQNKKHVWVGGNTGVFLLNTNGNLLQQFDISDGLPDDFIYGILEDKHEKVWMSHNKGLSVYNPKTKTFKHYGIKDGLQSNEFNTGAYYKDPSGLLYFGGVNGINVINPDDNIENKNVPQIAINEILLGDLPYKSDTAYNEIKRLTLSYLENTLSFNFSALEFSQPEDNTYQYKMEGYDNNWIESGTLHFARYANLPPGEYVFKIKAANGDGYWNPQPRELYISIIPPFWQRSWFYILTTLFGLALIVISFYAYNQRQQTKLKRELEVQHKLELERIRISRDLHDNVGAQLSYLITNIDWMLRHPEQVNKEEEKNRLQTLSEAGRNAILTLRQTIWAVSSNSLSVDDFADRFKQFALKMLEFDKNISVTFNEHITSNNLLSPSVALNLFRICQESFNNCLKHAACTHIEINFSSDGKQQFQFMISDNGKGFDVENSEKINHYGIQNMKARAKECGAELVIQSKEGSGTSISLQLI